MGVILDSSVLIASERGKFDLEAMFRAYSSEVFQIAAIQRVPSLRLLDVTSFGL